MFVNQALSFNVFSVLEISVVTVSFAQTAAQGAEKILTLSFPLQQKVHIRKRAHRRETDRCLLCLAGTRLGRDAVGLSLLNNLQKAHFVK